MKILHTADWHIGKKLENFSRVEEQKLVLEEICLIADSEKVDAIIIAGDLFDTFNPSSESVELFYKTLKRLSNEGKVPVIAISGNHDSPDRVETADPLARECGIIFLGYPDSKTEPFKLDSGLKISIASEGFIELQIPTVDYPFRLITTPYANEFRIKQILKPEEKEVELRNLLQESWEGIANKYCDENGVNVLATHLFVVNKGETIQEEPDDEKPILHVGGAQAIYTENFPKGVQYVALGHLHRKQIISSTKLPIVYAGSPLSYSFSEANQQKFVMIIDLKPNKEAKLKAVELKQGKKLIRIQAVGINEAKELLLKHKDCLIELTLQTDEYISAKDRQFLNQIHDGIITLIPQIKTSQADINRSKGVDISKDLKSLFSDYFKHTNNGISPNEGILNLLDEVIAEKD